MKTRFVLKVFSDGVLSSFKVKDKEDARSVLRDLEKKGILMDYGYQIVRQEYGK